MRIPHLTPRLAPSSLFLGILEYWNDQAYSLGSSLTSRFVSLTMLMPAGALTEKWPVQA